MVFVFSFQHLGETYNGHLVNCDGFMNLNLKEVICTSPDGEHFQRLPEVHLKGISVKYMRIPDEVIDLVREEKYRSRGGFQGRGRGRGGSHVDRNDRSDRGGSLRGRGRGRNDRGRERR